MHYSLMTLHVGLVTKSCMARACKWNVSPCWPIYDLGSENGVREARRQRRSAGKCFSGFLGLGFNPKYIQMADVSSVFVLRDIFSDKIEGLPDICRLELARGTGTCGALSSSYA